MVSVWLALASHVLYGLDMRNANGDDGMMWCCIEDVTGLVTVTWHETQEDAETHGNTAVLAAKEDGYHVAVFVCRLRKIASV